MVLDGVLFNMHISSQRKCVHGAGMSYRKAKWLPEADVMEAKPQLLRNFMQRRNAGAALQDPTVACKDDCDRHGWAGRQHTEQRPDAEAGLLQSALSLICSMYKRWHRAQLRAVSGRGHG